LGDIQFGKLHVMKVTFISNACCVYEANRMRILTDPWLVDGAFEGAWFHAPALKTKPHDLTDVDALFISHIHPDHYDLKTLSAFRRDIPIFILDAYPGFLKRSLENLGFKKVIVIPPEKPYEFGPFELTLFSPFAKHAHHEAEIGNLIDSAILVKANNRSIFNANDNALTLETAADIAQRFGPFTVAQLNYNAAGPFPSCFDNLSDTEKQERHRSVLDRNLAHMVSMGETLGCEYIMPFAGAYVIGGKEWTKNRYLGTTTWDEAADYVTQNSQGIKALVLNEGQSFDLKTNSIINGPYQPIDVAAQNTYIESILSKKRYPYEEDESLAGISALTLSNLMRPFLKQARQSLWRAQERYDHQNSWTVAIALQDGYFTFRMDSEDSSFQSLDTELPEPYLRCQLDMRLLAQILLRKAHWNSAEIGCHINFYRKPDQYLPDIHTLMSFFALPVERTDVLAYCFESCQHVLHPHQKRVYTNP